MDSLQVESGLPGGNKMDHGTVGDDEILPMLYERIINKKHHLNRCHCGIKSDPCGGKSNLRLKICGEHFEGFPQTS